MKEHVFVVRGWDNNALSMTKSYWIQLPRASAGWTVINL